MNKGDNMRIQNIKKKDAINLYVRWDEDERKAAFEKARKMRVTLSEMVRRAIAAYNPNEHNDWR
jgi:hypothetical protein